MKKYLLLLAAFGLFFFASCSDDDDDDTAQLEITGTWELTSVSPQIPGWDFSACPDNPEITFTQGGSANWTLYDEDNNCAAVSSSGSWMKNQDNTYTVTIPDFGQVNGTVTFSGANQFNFNTSIENFPVVLTFQR